MDPRPYLPWVLDFDGLTEENPFWQWEEKWREYYPFTGKHFKEKINRSIVKVKLFQIQGLEFKGTNEKIKTLKKFLKESAKKVVDEAKLFQVSFLAKQTFEIFNGRGSAIVRLGHGYRLDFKISALSSGQVPTHGRCTFQLQCPLPSKDIF